MGLRVRARLVELIVCPDCKGALSVASRQADGDEIIEGSLHCKACPREYPIHGGIPRLLPRPEVVSDAAQRTVDRFGEQWNEFDFLGPHYEQQFLGWISPNGPEAFQGKLVLEGGCGKGRHSALCAQWGAKDVLAVDLGSAVEAAYRNTRDYPNVHVIQADLFHLPVRPLRSTSPFRSASSTTPRRRPSVFRSWSPPCARAARSSPGSTAGKTTGGSSTA